MPKRHKGTPVPVDPEHFRAAREGLRLAVGAVDDEGLRVAAEMCVKNGQIAVCYAGEPGGPSLADVGAAIQRGGPVEMLRLLAPRAAARMTAHERQKARDDLAALVEQRRAGRGLHGT